MKSQPYTLLTAVLCCILFTQTSNGNWIKNQNRNSFSQENNSTSVLQSGEAAANYEMNGPDKRDSLPKGFTDDVLRDLRDENGNKIMPTGDPGDEIDAMQQRVFNGFNAADGYGASVASAGDVNGDGFDDMLIGAPNNDAAALNAGRVYIYFGGLNINSLVDVILTGELGNNLFGNSVASAGDVNADGYDDVVVGAVGFSNGSGRAYVFYGGLPMNNVADVVFGTAAGGTGKSVSRAGDVNGDGYSDVIIGENLYNAGGSFQGRALIYYGGPSMNNAPDVIIPGEAANYEFGISVCTAGNVNGDDCDDVIVGAWAYANHRGKAYIFYGDRIAMDIEPDVTFTGLADNHYFGYSVSTAGDINGDGLSDVIVGAYAAGRADIFFGHATAMDNIPDVTMTGVNMDFGYSVSTAGDINGDGYSDVIVGADYFSNYIGKAFIFYGGIAMNNSADFTMTGDVANDLLGQSVSAAGDINGDGYSDVIIGARGYNGNTGRAYLVTNTMTGTDIPDEVFTGEGPNNSFGVSVSTAGDVNGDGYSDIIVGAHGYASSTGRAYIFYGGTPMNYIADVTMTGEAAGNNFGFSVSTAGDVNGDGYSDVIIGAVGYGVNSSGKSYVYFGGMSMNNVVDVSLFAEPPGNGSFGISVSTAGDVNGDGYSDIIIGAHGYANSTGRAYLYLGGASISGAPYNTFYGEAATNFFGYSVSKAGDVNGDGYSDIIIGAYGYNNFTGRTYIFWGGTSMNNSADITITGTTPGKIFGQSVSTAEDVNGDGFSDVIVGAQGSFTTDTGRAYIFYGGLEMNNTIDVNMTVYYPANYFGYSVSTAGDVNTDGYSDEIVGTNLFTGASAYIFYGGAQMDNSADVTMAVGDPGNYFGRSVSLAGDVNGDGYSDVIVGASGYVSGSGSAYLYQSSAPAVIPGLLYVRDVPNDQGGYVHLKWARSGYDVTGINMITDYVVQRSYPPVGGNFAWENIAYIPATVEPFYAYTSATPNDLSSGSSGIFYYRITARTALPNQYWRSQILSGHSIDNIAPEAVRMFTANPVPLNVVLSWRRNFDFDLLNYILYRSYSETIDPGTETPFAVVTDSTYTDTLPLNGAYNYFIVAQDIHNNKSPVTRTSSPGIALNLTMFIEGFYNSNANSQVSDTIKVYLHNVISPFSKVDSAKAVAGSNGSAVLNFGNAPNGTYYIVVNHRNSIQTWSKQGGENMSIGAAVNYNMSDLVTKAFGNNITSIDTSPVRYGIYSGDVNQDYNVDLTDMVLTYNDAINFISGYKATDVNGDNFSDLTDVIIVFNNSVDFVNAVRP